MISIGGVSNNGMTLAIEMGSEPQNGNDGAPKATAERKYALDYESFNERPRDRRRDEWWETDTQRLRAQRAKDLRGLAITLGCLLGMAVLFLIVLSIVL